MTSYAVSRGHPAPLVGKILLADVLRVYFCLDSYLVGVPLALCGRFVLVCYHPKKWKTKKTLVKYVQL